MKDVKTQNNIKGPFVNLLVNIIIPIYVLKLPNKDWINITPFWALIAALSFPLIYGIYDYISEKKRNFFSLFGIINVMSTGGLALYQLEGHWFAVKEALLPLLIGVFIFFSSFRKKPFLMDLIKKAPMVDYGKIQEHFAAQTDEAQLTDHLKRSTFYLSLSFFLSSLLNYVLAMRIFTKIPEGLAEMEKANLLNEQISQMTWQSFLVIAIPSTIISFFVMLHVAKGIKKVTGLEAQAYIIE